MEDPSPNADPNTFVSTIGDNDYQIIPGKHGSYICMLF